MELVNNSYIEEMAVDYVGQELEERKRIFKYQLKELKDEEIRNAIVNIDLDNWKYGLLKNELKRRERLRL